MADSCVCRGVSFHADDLVERAGEVGVIIACFQYDSNGLLILLVELMRRVSPTRFQQTSVQRFWQASFVQLLLAWKSLGVGLFEVIGMRYA